MPAPWRGWTGAGILVAVAIVSVMDQDGSGPLVDRMTWARHLPDVQVGLADLTAVAALCFARCMRSGRAARLRPPQPGFPRE